MVLKDKGLQYYTKPLYRVEEYNFEIMSQNLLFDTHQKCSNSLIQEKMIQHSRFELMKSTFK